jgi:hypothetical protein
MTLTRLRDPGNKRASSLFETAPPIVDPVLAGRNREGNLGSDELID